MLKLKPNSKRVPFGGHHFPSHGITFRGDSFDEVKQKLTDFRINNNLPLGNPEQEVLNFYAEKWPWLVYQASPTEVETQSQEYIDWAEWIQSTWRNPPQKFITTKEAEDRWKTCKDCPFNQKKDWKETKESAELTRRAYLMRRGIAVPEVLGFCALHRADLSAFVFIDKAKDFSKKAPDKNYEGCWVI